jgi:F-type H+-transporting ATPase subunit gamma
MAGGQERILRRRIKSIKSTQKITKAMELIAASQIVRAQGRIAASKPYQDGMARIVLETALGDPTAAGRLLGTPEEVAKVLVRCVVADRGLCGGYNTTVFRTTERWPPTVWRPGWSPWARRPWATSGSAARRSSSRSSV